MPVFPIPVSVLTGFLGSGKTTLLNRLIKEPQLADTAVIVNEFGEVSIDHALVERATDGIIELAGGCLCCTVRGELVDTLSDLVERLRDGRIAAMKRIVIETTGLADPAPVLHALMAHPMLVRTLRLDGVVTTVDAVHGARTLDVHPEAVKQVAVADRLVLTKTDLADPAGVADLRAALHSLNPNAKIREASRADDLVSLLACGLYDPETKSVDVQRWLGRAAHDDVHDDHHHHDHGDHHHHHDTSIRTFSLTHPGPIPSAAVEMFVDLLQASYGERLLRMKGIIELSEDPAHPLVLHGVQTILHPPARLPKWPEGTRGTRMILITKDVPEDYVRKLFAALTSRPAVDTPDRAAMTDNPLAIAGLKI
ncbi:CobW family GTP-binding protein [Tianweitania populi]|uniref:CobW family GTP-binding protein n=1 Tax=Tianweitania populi TaxID=1607949 RepID=UPI0016725EC9|nr:GTP-binding protein [Tianweitania populi]